MGVLLALRATTCFAFDLEAYCLEEKSFQSASETIESPIIKLLRKQISPGMREIWNLTYLKII